MEAEREEEEREAKERKTEGGTLSEATVDRSPTRHLNHLAWNLPPSNFVAPVRVRGLQVLGHGNATTHGVF